jgi:hypothetical protein
MRETQTAQDVADARLLIDLLDGVLELETTCHRHHLFDGYQCMMAVFLLDVTRGLAVGQNSSANTFGSGLKKNEKKKKISH